MNNYLVFVAAGGHGTRLWKEYPQLKESGLPKSLGLQVNGIPILSYQLNSLIKLNPSKIILSFNDQKSIRVCKRMILQGFIPYFDYKFDLSSPYHPDNTTIDIIRKSRPNKPWLKNFDAIVITSGDVYFNKEHLSKMEKLYRKENCSVLTICNFEKYMIALNTHYHPVYSEFNYLKKIVANKKIPKEIVCHPQFIDFKTFNMYLNMGEGTSKSEFANLAIMQGQKIKVLKPKQYVNVNYPRDFEKAMRLLAKNKQH